MLREIKTTPEGGEDESLGVGVPVQVAALKAQLAS